jgi:hypothetical protein
MARAISIYVKKQIRLDRLNFSQQSMAGLGMVGLKERKASIAAGHGPNDGPAKPLSKAWAAIKRRSRLQPIRDLRGTGLAFGNQLSRAKKRRKTGRRFIGHMIDNLGKSFRVTDTGVRIGFSTYAARIKARANEKIEPFLIWSPRNRQAIYNKAISVFSELVKKLPKAA